MCIAAIIHKPISLKWLKAMDEDNPHGGGMAWLDKRSGKIRFERGLGPHKIFAIQEGLYKSDKFKISYPYLLHFRWATHGPRTRQLTHPFPTGPRAFKGELSGSADEVIIHNGVWNDYAHWVDFVGDEVPDKHLKNQSDTAFAAYFYRDYPEIGDEIPWAVASARVVQGTLVVTKHGGWTSHDGNEFSNLSWIPADEWAQIWKAGTYNRESEYTGLSRSGSGGSVYTYNRHLGGWSFDGDYNPNPLPHKEYASFEDFVASKELQEKIAADALRDAMLAELEQDYVPDLGCDERSECPIHDELTPLNDDSPDADFWSEDPAVVNAWLEAESRRLAKQKDAQSLLRDSHEMRDSFEERQANPRTAA